MGAWDVLPCVGGSHTSWLAPAMRLCSAARRPGWHGERTLPIAMPTEHISFDSPFPSVVTADGKHRIVEFLKRHGGAAPDVEHEADRFVGDTGWSEVHAADGYRLRCEWSVFGREERQMSFVEIAPEPAVADKTG